MCCPALTRADFGFAEFLLKTTQLTTLSRQVEKASLQSVLLTTWKENMITAVKS